MKFDKVIIDADSILYKSALSQESKRYYVSDKEFIDEQAATKYADGRGLDIRSDRVLVGSLESAVDYFKDSIRAIGSDTGAGDIVAFTGGPNDTFRDRIATIKPYKGNRTSTLRPLLPHTSRATHAANVGVSRARSSAAFLAGPRL